MKYFLCFHDPQLGDYHLPTGSFTITFTELTGKLTAGIYPSSSSLPLFIYVLSFTFFIYLGSFRFVHLLRLHQLLLFIIVNLPSLIYLCSFTFVPLPRLIYLLSFSWVHLPFFHLPRFTSPGLFALVYLPQSTYYGSFTFEYYPRFSYLTSFTLISLCSFTSLYFPQFLTCISFPVFTVMAAEYTTSVGRRVYRILTPATFAYCTPSDRSRLKDGLDSSVDAVGSIPGGNSSHEGGQPFTLLQWRPVSLIFPFLVNM